MSKEKQLYEILRSLQRGEIGTDLAHLQILRLFVVSGQLPPNNCQKCGRSGYSMGTPFCTDEYCNGGNLR
jgi:hypothetical protein